jgi:mannosyl-oligosaccharide alpha-1,2-mannosidase
MHSPETIESLFIAFRLTGDKVYREYGWSIFQSIQKHCRVETGGYASIINVDQNPAVQEDKMETFLMVRSLRLISNSRVLTVWYFEERNSKISLSFVL